MSNMTSQAPMPEKIEIPVWDLPTRVFHWLFAASFCGAYLTAESEHFRLLHVTLGYTFGGLLAFRLFWGILGSRYARFSSFVYSPGELRDYLLALIKGKAKHYLGHKPAGALAIFLMLILGLLTAASGFANYQELGGDWLEELHEGCAELMLGLVAVHLAGVVVSSHLHRENLPLSMLTGLKQGLEEEGIRHSHLLLGILLALLVLGFWSMALIGWPLSITF